MLAYTNASSCYLRIATLTAAFSETSNNVETTPCLDTASFKGSTDVCNNKGLQNDLYVNCLCLYNINMFPSSVSLSIYSASAELLHASTC